MDALVLAGIAVNQTPFDWEGNLHRLVAGIEEARATGAIIVCFPELCLSGYGCEDAWRLPLLRQASVDALRNLVPHTRELIVAVGVPWWYEGALYNACAVIVDGSLQAVAFKTRISTDPPRHEDRWFRSWPAGKRAVAAVDGRSVPVGDLTFKWQDLLFQVRIGEDCVSDSPAGENVDLILNPVADPFGLGRFSRRCQLLIEHAQKTGATYLSANLLGNEAGRIIYDGSVLVVTPDGRYTASSRLSFRQVNTVVCSVRFSPRATAAATTKEKAEGTVAIPALRLDLSPKVSYGAEKRLTCGPSPARWEQSEYLREEEFARAEALGLFDYMRKTRARGYVVNLSGGADSSAIATLIALAIRWAYEELGRDTFLRTLAYFPELAEEHSVEGVLRRVLRLVFQPSCNSSEASRRAAQAVADALAVPLAVVPIDPIVHLYVQAAEKVLGRPLRWETDDVALQNIQSRVRAPLGWLLANAEGKLFVATGNRSEAVVGYATMDGDTCGGIAPLGCVSKAFLRKWLVWLERVGPTGIGPFPVLSLVNSLPPSAELRPPESGQTDEGEVMPYIVLEAIEEAILRDEIPIGEVATHLAPRLLQFSQEQLSEWVEKFLRMWGASQWKRERLAPAFFIGDDSSGAWMFRRLPILSAGLSAQPRSSTTHTV